MSCVRRKHTRYICKLQRVRNTQLETKKDPILSTKHSIGTLGLRYRKSLGAGTPILNVASQAKNILRGLQIAPATTKITPVESFLAPNSKVLT
jgi:hypothetical protein